MRLRTRPELRLAALAAIAVACALTIRSASNSRPAPVVPPVRTAGLVGDVRPAVSLGDLEIVVLRTPSVAQRLPAGAVPTEQEERTWVVEDYAAQQEVLSDLEAHGLGVRPDYSFSRVLDGFSAALGPRAVTLLEHDADVAGVYPVSVAYPATVSSAALTGTTAASAGVELPGFDGAGVTVALLDTGVDAHAPYLGGRVEGGIDVVGGASAAGAPAAGSARLEAHGTELAGLLVGSGGPDGIEGIVPGARVLPIRVAGLQPDGHGGDALYGRSDQLIAGLDRAVDPTGAGNVQQAVRVALVGLAEPFDGFADTPEAQAVAGALRLGVLVVAPAGNDGAAGPWFGSVAGPGGSPAALTVGALDARPETSSERLVVRDGLDVIADAATPLLDAGSPGAALDLPVAAGARSSLRGAAALVSSGSDPAAAVDHALEAGARAVLLAGAAPSAGSLGSLDVPVVSVPEALAGRVRALVSGGAAVEVALGGVRAAPNPGFDRLAGFSSRGVAFDGLVDPELSAPGVGVATSDPGEEFATVSGTSAAAAAVAGAAALLVQARPSLTGPEVASLLVGSAHAGTVPLSGGGTGVVDVGAAAAGEVAATETSLGFGVWSGARWRASRPLTLVNVSTRPLHLSFATGSSLVGVAPARLTLAPGAQATVTVDARASAPPPGVALDAGILRVLPAGARALRVPWTIVFARPAATLVGTPAVSPSRFSPSDTRPARLAVTLGAVSAGASPELEPVSRFELRLTTARGASLGVLATLTDLLPGSYDFALTGRAPDGARLSPGDYELVLVAWPMGGGAPSRGRVGFQVAG